MRKPVSDQRSFMSRLALRRPSDFVLKPVYFQLAVLVLYFVVERMIYAQADIDSFLYQLPLVSITAFPFILFGFLAVTRLDRMQTDLATLALTDTLTKLPNRRSFEIQVENLQAHNTEGFLLILDADHFKRVNDTYGHAVGDECLIAISRRLHEVKGPDDIYGRIGGEEFGAYLPFRTAAELREIGQNLCRPILVEVASLDAPLRLTMSVGATESHKNENLASAFQRADEALYVAKSTGRARMVRWTKSMKNTAA
jgi:diguanylate cyclase (GGDEF)-like protein